MARKWKASEVYLRAAELLQSGREGYSCVAIKRAYEQLGYGCYGAGEGAADRFMRTMGFDHPASLQLAFGDAEDRHSCNHRILALLLMSEIAKDGELPRKRKERKGG